MRILIIMMLLFFSLQIIAQDQNQVKLIGDRPGQTASAFIVPRGYIHIEDGFIYENENERIQNINYSSVLLRYGLFENFELRFATGFNKVQNTSFDDLTGFSPISVGAKVHVNQEKGWLPQIAFIANLNLSKTGSPDFKQDYNSAQMALSFSNTINDYISLGYSIGVGFSPDVQYSVGTYTLISGITLTDKIGAFIEIYGDFSKSMVANNNFNGGLSYLVLPQLQLDVSGGIGLSESSAKNYFSIGFVYMFKP